MADKRKGLRVHTQFKPGREQALAKHTDDPITLGIDGSIVINTALLRPPKSVYDADVAWVVRRKPEFVSFFFAKENLTEDTFRTRVEIKYPLEAFYSHLWNNTRELHATLKTDRPLPGLVREPVEKLMKRQAERDHSDWANFEIMTRSGFHGCIDFFLLSPAGVARLATGGGSSWLEAAGVLRVNVAVSEMRGLLDEAEAIALDIASMFPEQTSTQSVDK